jgi:hypothetical protein
MRQVSTQGDTATMKPLQGFTATNDSHYAHGEEPSLNSRPATPMGLVGESGAFNNGYEMVLDESLSAVGTDDSFALSLDSQAAPRGQPAVRHGRSRDETSDYSDTFTAKTDDTFCITPQPPRPSDGDGYSSDDSFCI